MRRRYQDTMREEMVALVTGQTGRGGARRS